MSTLKKLPQVEHEGLIFTVDVKLKEVRQTDKPFLSLSFDRIESDELAGKVADVWIKEAGIIIDL